MSNDSNDSDKELSGRLVFLTTHMDVWLRQVNPKFNIPMANRIAKVVKVFDWDTAEGKLLLREREKTGKWKNLDPKEFKFVLKIYYPDLVKDNKDGITVEEVVPRFFPKTEMMMLNVIPEWMLKSLQKEEKDILKLVPNTKKKKSADKDVSE
jgi:hypothetical protein